MSQNRHRRLPRFAERSVYNRFVLLLVVVLVLDPFSEDEEDYEQSVCIARRAKLR